MLNLLGKMFPAGKKPQATSSEPEQANVTDYIYGFIFWLSESPNRIYKIGGAETQAHHHIALAKFCEENNLPQLSDNWQDKIKKPNHFF